MHINKEVQYATYSSYYINRFDSPFLHCIVDSNALFCRHYFGFSPGAGWLHAYTINKTMQYSTSNFITRLCTYWQFGGDLIFFFPYTTKLGLSFLTVTICSFLKDMSSTSSRHFFFFPLLFIQGLVLRRELCRLSQYLQYTSTSAK